MAAQARHRRDEQPAHHVAERIYKDEHKRICHSRTGSEPGSGRSEVVHIGYAVLKAAHDEHRHAEKHREVFPQLVRYGAVALYGYVYEYVAEDGENKHA